MEERSLAEYLRVLRARRGLSIRDASAGMGIQWHTLRDIELGRRVPHTPTLSKIARFYDEPAEDFMRMAEADTRPKASAPPETPEADEGRRVPAQELDAQEREGLMSIAASKYLNKSAAFRRELASLQGDAAAIGELAQDASIYLIGAKTVTKEDFGPETAWSQDLVDAIASFRGTHADIWFAYENARAAQDAPQPAENVVRLEDRWRRRAEAS